MARILIVDDEPPIRRVLSRILEAAGHEVISTPDGHQGLAAYRTHPPDLVLMDMFMPGMNGVEMVARLQADFPSARVVCVSGGGDRSDFSQLSVAEHLGIRGVITKPFATADVLSAVQAVLG